MKRFKRTEEKASSVDVLTYKFMGYPGETVSHTLYCFCRGCDFMWNRFWADSRDFYALMGESLNPVPSDYKDDDDLSWLNDIDSLALVNVQNDFTTALNNFLEGRADAPKFKKKGQCKISYTTSLSNKNNPNLRLDGNLLKLPKIKEPIPLHIHRKIKQGGLLKRCTVSQDYLGRWYFSLTFEYPKEEVVASDINDKDFKHIGLDMSLSSLYVDSNGNEADFEKPYRRTEAKLAKEQRKLSRMKGARKGETKSNNYIKQQQKVAALHAKIKHQRADALHKISKELTDTYDLISIEDLNLSAMKRSFSGFGKSVSDNGWGIFATMLSYKQTRKGHYLVKVSRFFPSSKKCCSCGYIHKELKLSDRTYLCPVCGNIMNRDYQAGINIDEEGFRILREQLSFS